MTPPPKPAGWNNYATAETSTLVTLGTCPQQRRGVVDEVADHLARFVAFPSDAALVAAALWVLHTHTVDVAESTPRLAFLSPEPGSGKSRALEVLATLVPHPMEAVNASPAALFRSVGGDTRPTILFDEIDTVFGPKAKENEELRGFLNAGHRRGAVAHRCVGEKQEVRAFPAYAAVAVAGLHDLPDTLAHRSIIIRMRRRGPNETVEPFRQRIHRPEGEAIRDQVAAWAADVINELRDHYPQMPDGVTDRPADVWEPLLSIAEVVGGDWPDRARQACVAIVHDATHREPSISVRLLDDIRTVYADKGNPPFIATADLLTALRGMDEAPWATYGKDGLTPRTLARKLTDYGVTPHLDRPTPGADPLRGYRRNDLADPWQRYLPPFSTGDTFQALQPYPAPGIDGHGHNQPTSEGHTP